MPINSDKKRIEEIFNRGVVSEVLPSKEELFKVLDSGKKLRIYLGADPTSNSLHLNHAKNYMFLEELRQLGHEVIVLVGDFTAQIGDPTGKESTRKQLTKKEAQNNAVSWKKNLKNIINFQDKTNPAKIKYNSKWLEKLSFKDVVSLASNFTVQQMLERDMFEKRIESNTPIHLHEFLYPLMQGYDSVAMDVDIELCGTDQTFNAMAGRVLQKRINNKEKFVIVLKLGENPKTGKLMSKSEGTGVFLASSPEDMFGAIMSQPDEMTEVFFVNNTRIPLEQKENIFSLGPKEAKEKIALEVVKNIHGEKQAQKAQFNFSSVFGGGGIPQDAPTYKMKEGETVIESLFNAGIGTKSEIKRLITLWSVKNLNTEEVVKNWTDITKEGTYKIGKHRFLKII